MIPELEALLELLDAYLEGDPAKAEELCEAYEKKVEEHSAGSGIPAAIIMFRMLYFILPLIISLAILGIYTVALRVDLKKD